MKPHLLDNYLYKVCKSRRDDTCITVCKRSAAYGDNPKRDAPFLQKERPFWRKGTLLCLFILLSTFCFGQNDTIPIENTSPTESISAVTPDSLEIKEKPHSPKLAGALSAALPGLGQAYNKKYWKIPIDYAGFAATGFCVYHFHSLYAAYRDEYRHRLKGEVELYNPDWKDWHNENIVANRQLHQRNMQLSILFLGLWYVINILDAVVDAHLMSYDISDNLSMRLAPDILSSGLAQNGGSKNQHIGLSFTLNLKL
jgi:hypothetical protein